MPSNEPERIYTFGGFGHRLVALLVDAVLLYVLGFVVRPLFPYPWLLVGFAYFVIFTAAWGATPGKFILGLRVVDADGHRPSLLRILLREVIGRLLLLMYVAFAISPQRVLGPEKRGWHDHIGGTWVVRPASADEIQAEFRLIEDALATESAVGPDRLTGIHPSWRVAFLREFARAHAEEAVVSGGVLRRTGAVELI